MATPVYSTSRPLQPSLRGAFLGALFAIVALTVLTSLVVGGALLLLASSVSLTSF